MTKKIKPANYWTPKNIDRAFDDLVEQLRRIPLQDELPIGALNAIRDRRYNSNFKGYNDYLKHWKFKLNKVWGKWDNPKNVDESFDDLVETLGRVPKAKELPRGAFEAMIDGRYLLDVKGYNDYLRHWGLEVNHEMKKWDNPNIVDESFDSLTETLRRIPKYDEMPRGARNSIEDRRYHPNVKGYNDYLRHWGFKLNREHKDLNGLIQRLLED